MYNYLLFVLVFLISPIIAMHSGDFNEEILNAKAIHSKEKDVSNPREIFSIEIIRTLYLASFKDLPLYIPSKAVDTNTNIAEIIGKPDGIYLKTNNEIILGKDLFWIPASVLSEKIEERKIMQSRLRVLPTFLQPAPDLVNSLDRMAELLSAAKRVAKSFLLPSNDKIKEIEKNYVMKKNINFNRIFTYAMFEKIIKEKNLIHIKLPHKILMVWDNKTKSYLERNKVAEVIDSSITIGIYEFELFYINTNFDKMSKDQEFVLFASKEECEGPGLNKQAMEELRILFQNAPFDVGFDNIFWNKKGDAIIIDTEYKGTPVRDIDKLRRYPVISPKL